MKSLPEPHHLSIWLDEAKIARGDVKAERAVLVRAEWFDTRELENSPIRRFLREVPFENGCRYGSKYAVVRLRDGSYTVVPEQFKEDAERGEWVGEPAPGFEEYHYFMWFSSWREYLEFGARDLKRVRPDFDYTAWEENANQLIWWLQRFDGLIRVHWGAELYLEWVGGTRKKLEQPVKNPARAMRVAILRDVFGKRYREIAEELGLELSETDRRKSTSRRAEAVKRGRQLLECRFGPEGWRERVERMLLMAER